VTLPVDQSTFDLHLHSVSLQTLTTVNRPCCYAAAAVRFTHQEAIMKHEQTQDEVLDIIARVTAQAQAEAVS